MKRLFTLVAATALAGSTVAQTCQDFAVRLTATVQSSPAKITLNWKRLADTTVYNVYKKNKTALTWSSSLASLTTNDSTWTDNSVIVDSAYEYLVVADHHSGTTRWTGTGFVYAGIKAPAIHSRGGLVLVVDSTYTDSCADGLRKLMKDLSGDGWQVIRHDVSRSTKDTTVKTLIKNDYSTIANVKAVLLVGHVAVPYSGDLNPDGHTDHKGAWPTDIYYADMTGTWTDGSIFDTSAGYAANRNIPGDGKWDQTFMPAPANLQVSRIDLYDMPAFSRSDIQLMRSYLAKDHIYKMDSLPMRRRAIISDNFGVFSVASGGTTYYEAFASTAWRSFPPLLSNDSIATTSAMIANLDTASYQWSYGCGGGWFSGAGGIGSTSDFASHNFNGIFTVIFGSYFGDWNVQNNFLRAPLCANSPALTNCWSGRPYWFFHHMALGENIGFSNWHSQNNDGATYGPGNIYGFQQIIHVNLMGDLSLRTDYIQPARNIVLTHTPKHGANISWTASADAGVIGYYVYRATSEFGSYQRISNMVSGTSFSDTVGPDGLKYYMVRPVKLQSTPSGAYYNLGIGITDSASVTYNHTAVEEVSTAVDFNIFPNPASDVINVAITATTPATAKLSVMNVAGQQFASATKMLEAGKNAFSLNISDLPAGMYTVQVVAGEKTIIKKWVKL